MPKPIALRSIILALLAALPLPALACGAPICTVAPETLKLTRIVTFEDVPISPGIGAKIDVPLEREGVSFGERFKGQRLERSEDFDRLAGLPAAPLVMVIGERRKNLGSMKLPGTVVLHGLGPEGYPRGAAAGEGTIAFLFAEDQAALSFVVPGGENGTVTVTFHARDGRVIHRVTLGPLTGQGFGFHRDGFQPDIAGVTIENDDPQGIAIDDLRFEAVDLMG